MLKLKMLFPLIFIHALIFLIHVQIVKNIKRV